MPQERPTRFPALREMLGQVQLATQQAKDYRPEHGAQTRRREAFEGMLAGDRPMVPMRADEDPEAVRRQLRAQVDALDYFRDRAPPVAAFGTPGPAPSRLDQLLARLVPEGRRPQLMPAPTAQRSPAGRADGRKLLGF